MTDTATNQAQKARQEAQAANDQLAQANQNIQDLKKGVADSASSGDPKKASADQLITGDY